MTQSYSTGYVCILQLVSYRCNAPTEIARGLTDRKGKHACGSWKTGGVIDQ